MRRSLIESRLRYLAVLALGCGASEQNGVPGGLIVAPMVASGSASPKLASGDGGIDSGSSSVARLPLPSEPSTPSGQSNCLRKVDCRPEDDETPTMAFPNPFERCAPKTGKNDAQFSVAETRTRREWDPHACCYVEFTGCTKQPRVVPGRPLRKEDGALVTADLEARTDWLADLGTAAPDLERAQKFLEEAAVEHASVAAFARVALELLALGAPPALVARAHECALDEIEHARACYALAARFGVTRGPAPLPIPHFGAIDRAAFAKSALLDGFGNEATAAQMARDRAEIETDAVVRAVLEKIAEDEERHAVFGLEAARWALAECNASVIDETLAALDSSEVARFVVAPVLRALAASLEAQREGDRAPVA